MTDKITKENLDDVFEDLYIRVSGTFPKHPECTRRKKEILDALATANIEAGKGRYRTWPPRGEQNDLNSFKVSKGQTPDDILRELADRFESKNELWGDAWVDAGDMMDRLLPGKFSKKEWGKVVCLVFITLKMQRMVKGWPNLSEDSLGDLITYGSMLASLQGKK